MKDHFATVIHCYKEHLKDIGGIVYFDMMEYALFWLNHFPGRKYTMTNKDKSQVIVTIAYYPLPYYKDLRACIEFPIPGGIDFRDVPIKFLKPSL